MPKGCGTMAETGKEIVVAGGCFWGVEEYYRRVKGILTTKCGYAQGMIENPTYQQVKTGTTYHAESVYLTYDSQIISAEKIMELLFRIIEPVSLNKQGEDEGTQYRTGIYCLNEDDLKLAHEMIQKLQESYQEKVVVEVEMLDKFYDAEEYHQKYLVKNPAGYCHVDFRKLKPEECK